MAEISKLSRLMGGASRNISFATNTLVVDNLKLKLGGTGSVSFSGALTSDYTIGVPNENVNLGNVNSLNTLSGVSAGSANLGAFPGSVIQNNRSIKGALQDLESYIESNTGGTFSDVNFSVYDDIDPSKRILFQASGIATGQSRSILMPNSDVDLGLISTHETRLDDVEDSVTDHETRISVIEDALSYSKLTVFSSNSSVYQDGSRGTADTSSDFRDGWYFKNTSIRQSINWKLFDEPSSITLDNFFAYAVVTFDSTIDTPYITIYTEPTGTGDFDPSYHSKAVYAITSPIAINEKYLIHVGNAPSIHPELPRIELTLDSSRSQGDLADSENVIKCNLETDAASVYDNLQFVVDRLGLNLASKKVDFSLRIKELSGKERFPINDVAQFVHIDLSKEVIESSLVVSIDRLMLHEDDDYTLSTVQTVDGLVTRLTWAGDIAIGGDSAIEIGDNIRVNYRHNA
jgi:hypothetical protein